MSGSLAVRSLLAQAGIQIHHVDLGDSILERPDPAIAMCTGEQGVVAIVPANRMCVSKCMPSSEPHPFGVIIEKRALVQIAERASVTMPLIDERHKDGLDDPPLRSILDTLQGELAHAGLASSLYVDALLAQLIVRVFRAYQHPLQLEGVPSGVPALPQDARLQRVLRFMDEHIDTPIGVDDIARAVDLSPFHFSRAFKRWTGESPHRFLLNHRPDLAQRMVVNTEKPLASIATSVGFYDQSHFGAHFKRRFGATPRQMRKNVRVA